jgi:para-aminobenzoate synthetase
VALEAGDGPEVDDWLDGTAAVLRDLGVLPAPAAPPPGQAAFHLLDDPERYRANIEACRRQIVEGETYEVCLTTELRSAATLSPFAACRALRARNPAPFAALVRLGELSVLSSSPERFLRVDRSRGRWSRRPSRARPHGPPIRRRTRASATSCARRPTSGPRT